MMDFGFDLAGMREPRLARGATLSAVAAMLEAAPTLVAFFVLDRVFAGTTAGLSVGWLTLGLLVLLLVSFGFRGFGLVDNFIATYRLVAATRLRLADHLRRLPMGFFNARRQGDTASLLTDEFAQYSEIASHAWGNVVANIALPVALALVLVLADWRLAVLAVLPVPFAMLAIPWAHARVNVASDNLSEQKRAVVADLTEFIDGLPTLTALLATGSFRARITDKLQRLSDQQMRTELAPAPAVLSFGLIVYSGFALVLVGGAYWVGTGAVQPARFVLVALLTAHFTRTLAELVLYLAASRYAARTLARMRKMFDEDVQPEGEAVMDGPPELCVEEVTFSYAGVPALHDVTIGLPRGTTTALVGPSGSGKSTLAHLLCRLWDVDQGRIELGGTDLRDLPLSEVHRQVATVFQHVVLFEDSVLENIRLGRPDATQAQVERAAKAAGAHAFITALPNGYDTMLGSDGVGLSGGEQQRIAIARALVKDAPILVLDEATASVDPDCEHEIQQAIARLMEGRTVVLIAHRLWTVQDVDQILVFDGGRVVERGTHPELLAANGLYAELWDAQQRSQAWSLGGADA